jgi:hypothetical protein
MSEDSGHPGLEPVADLGAATTLSSDTTSPAPAPGSPPSSEQALASSFDHHLNEETGISTPMSPTTPTNPASPTTPSSITQPEQQFVAQDPQLAQQIEQELAAEQAQTQANPAQMHELQTQFEQTAVQQVGQVDPQLAQDLAATWGLTADQQANPAVIAQLQQHVNQQEQQFSKADPQLAQQLAQEIAQAQTQAQADPSQAAQIQATLTQSVLAQIAHVNPQLAQQLAAEISQLNQASSSGLITPTDMTYNAAGQPESGQAPTSHVIGDPNQAASQWSYQVADGNCGPNSITMMIAATTGHQVSEEQVAQWAIQNNEMIQMSKADEPASGPSIHYGMTPTQVAATVSAFGQQYGVTATATQGDMNQLDSYLSQGREVIIFIDANTIWHDGPADPGAPNHFVIVTGYDPSTGTVFINDPGAPDGKEESIPLSEFKTAWAASNDTMIVTQSSSSSSGGAVDEAPQPGPVILPIVVDGGLVKA